MQGLEVVVVRLASTVVSTVARSALRPPPGAGLVERVLEGTVTAGQMLNMRDAESVALLPRLPQLTELNLIGDHGIPPVVLRHSALQFLGLAHNDVVGDLSPLRGLPHLKQLSLNRCPGVTDLSPLSGMPLTHVYLYDFAEGFSLAPLADLPDLRHLVFNFAAAETRLDELSFAPRLTGVRFFHRACATKLSGLDALTSLTSLTVNERHQWRDFLAAGVFSTLETLHILDVPHIDLADLVPHQGLAQVMLRKVEHVEHLAALAELPELSTVEFWGCGPLVLTPLAPLQHLDITLYDCFEVLGADLFPADRLHVE